MISKIHNTETCDCEMCSWADKQERKAACKHGTSGYCFPCVRERHNQDMLNGRFDEDLEREQVLHSITESVVERVAGEIFLPDFDSDWESAPRSKRARVERDDAEYWYAKGQQAKKIEMMLAHNQDLNEMARIARERRQ